MIKLTVNILDVPQVRPCTNIRGGRYGLIV